MPNTENEEIREEISQQQVNDVLNVWNFLEFTKSYKSELYNNSYSTPDIINAQLQNINMNPVEATYEGIISALSNPKSNEEILRNYSTYLETHDMYYKRLIRYLSDMACFNLNFDVINAYSDSDFKSEEFKEDLKILDNFSSRFNFKEEFQSVIRQIIRQGVYYCVLRDEGSKYTLQELPPNFCKITGRHDYGILFDFNFEWFMGRYGTDINMYPRVFKKMYNKVIQSSSPYNPSKRVDYRNTTFVHWCQCSPRDGFWCWKISPEIATLLPYFSPVFSDISNQSIIRQLQQDKYIIEASKLLVGIVGFNQETKTGSVANQMKMSPDMLGKFLALARKGLNKQVGLTALPVDEVKIVEFNTKQGNMLIDHSESISSQTVASSHALMHSEKLNAHQSKLASAIDNNLIKSLYPMFESFVEHYVNTKTKKYKFKIKFNDVDVPDDRVDRVNTFQTMATMGIVDFQQVSRICDISPFELDRRLSISKSMGFDKKLIPLLSLYNQTGDVVDNSNKKNIVETSDNDNTLASDENVSNDLK